MANGRYNTAAREAIIAFFCANPDRQFTADMVFDELSRLLNKTPGKSTVYRLLSILSEERVLRKYRDGADSGMLYQLVRGGGCEHHLHMKCTECGRVYHLECERSNDLLGHLLDEHGFRINSSISMLYGECEKCRKG
ncbi:MAG: transcriptional repressor [Clostridia bacterium]|nr:transcriptional repressor [Clostridia bacterium]